MTSPVFRSVIFFCLFILLGNFLSAAQDILYAKEVINKLTSAEMHGRGYVKKGDLKAAQYLKEQYGNFQLASFNGEYFQKFSIPVNTFPGKMTVNLDGKTLSPGVDYIVHPATQGEFGTFRIRELKFKVKNVDEIKKHFKSDYFHVIEFDSTISRKDKFEIIEYVGKTKYSAGTIVIEPKKLTWSVSSEKNSNPILYVLKNAWNYKAEKLKIGIKNKFIREYKSQNVIGYIPGVAHPDSFIFITAHYDHLGRMGKETIFPGANDNASGVSMLLQMAKYFSKSENKSDYTLVFACFAAEEAGILGSKHFVKSGLVQLDKIKFVLNMDLMGTGSKGITVVNGNIHKEEFKTLLNINDEKNYLIKIKPRGKAANSDHHFFTEAGVPAFFFYTLGGISAYHDVYDIAETLPLTEYKDVFNLFVDFISTFN